MGVGDGAGVARARWGAGHEQSGTGCACRRGGAGLGRAGREGRGCGKSLERRQGEAAPAAAESPGPAESPGLRHPRVTRPAGRGARPAVGGANASCLMASFFPPLQFSPLGHYSRGKSPESGGDPAGSR